MTAPYTRNWSANELPDFAGRNYHVEVKGEVETRSSNMVPKLRLHGPQGLNPRILLLDLTIELDGDLGGQVVMLRKAEYARPTLGNAYDQVDILFEGAIIERIKVGHPKTVAAAPKKKTAKKTGKKSARKAARKSPAKKKKAEESEESEKEKGREEEEKTLGRKRTQTSLRSLRNEKARGTIDDVIMPQATMLRTQASLRRLRNEYARALAMLRNKHLEMPGRKHDNLPV